MKRKEVEDVMGGKDAWENVDKADGMFARFLWGRGGEGGGVEAVEDGWEMGGVWGCDTNCGVQ